MSWFRKIPARAVRVFALLVVASCQPPVTLGAIPTGIQTDVSFIGSARQEGRAVGSAGSNRVASYIVQQYKALSLEGAFRAGCGIPAAACGDGFFQPFRRQNARNAKNIGAVIQGSDPALRSDYIVIGAHYDHVGRSATLSLDPDKNDEIRPGADDNASGTAAVLELGRRLAARPPRRSILLVQRRGIFISASGRFLPPELLRIALILIPLPPRYDLDRPNFRPSAAEPQSELGARASAGTPPPLG